MNVNDIIPVQMNAQEWNTVMSLLAEAPFKLSAPLIQHIQTQCMEFDRHSASQQTAVDNVTHLPATGLAPAS